MEIQINSCPVEFELSGEKTIGEVIGSIVDWTRNRNLIFTETAINNNNYSIDKIPDIPLDEIRTLNCIVQSKADLVISSINACIDYCAKSEEFFRKSVSESNASTKEIENVATGIDWIVELLTKISDMLGIDLTGIKYKDDPVQLYIDKIIKFKTGLIGNKKNSEKLLQTIEGNYDIFSAISSILKMLLISENMKALVIQSIDSPDVLMKTLIGIKDEIPNQLKNLEEIAVSYQTRNDMAGAEKLGLFINFIFNYSRACFQIASVFGVDQEKVIIDDISLSRKNDEIKDHLDNVMKVMENNDIISLSDILEYEMKSSLENLGVYIDALITYIEKRA
jgi:hypothetical protein